MLGGQQRFRAGQPVGSGPSADGLPDADRLWPSAPQPPGTRQARAILDVRRSVLADALRELTKAESATLAKILEKGLAHLSSSPGSRSCRLCDQSRCPRAECPVVQRQIELGAPPPQPVLVN